MNVNQIYGYLKKYSIGILLAWFCVYFLIKLRDRKTEKKAFFVLSATVYILVFLFITLLGRAPCSETNVQLEFLWEYRQAFAIENMRLKVQSQLWVGMIVNNILLFIPFGIFAAELLKNFQIRKMFPTILTIGFLLSVLVEVVQLYFQIGLFETDDILNNSIGAVLGYFLYFLAEKLSQKRLDCKDIA